MSISGIGKLIDAGVTRGGLRRFREYIHLYQTRKERPYRIELHYAQGASSLANLFDHYGSDKGTRKKSRGPYASVPHNYADVYEMLFSHCRNSVFAVFECGLGTNDTRFESNMGHAGRPGASLRAWRDYFPNAVVVGADIDSHVLFQEERIETYYVDQTDPESVRDLWNSVAHRKFNLMIDDGLHTAEAGIMLLQNSRDRLASGGIYVIEDVHPSQFNAYADFFREDDLAVTFLVMRRPGLPLGDNCMIIARDLGSSAQATGIPASSAKCAL